MNKVNKIKQTIINLKDLESRTLKRVFKKIKKLPIEEQNELYEFLLKTIKEDWFEEAELTKEELDENIREIRADFRLYTDLTNEEIDNLYQKNNFDANSILKIEKEPEVKEAEKEEPEEIAETNEEKIKTEENEIKTENINNGEELTEIEKIDKSIEQLKDELENIKNNRIKYSSKKDEELQADLEKMTEKRHGLYHDSVHKGIEFDEKDQEEYHELNKSIKEIEEELKERKQSELTKENDKKNIISNINRLKEEQKELWRIAITTGEELTEREERRFDEINKQIKELETQLNSKEKYKENSDSELEEKLHKMIEKRNGLYHDSAHKGVELDEKDQEEYHELNKMIKEIEEELKERKSPAGSKTNEINSKIAKLENIKKAYYTIRDEAITELEDEKISKLDKLIEEFVNNHELINELEGYENSEKLKQELKREIKTTIIPKEIEQKEKNKRIFYKSLAAVTGFLTGATLASVPGVGLIRMGIATAKASISAINFRADKCPNGKIAKIRNASGEYFEKKCPRIISGMKRMKNKLKSNPLNYFLNGMAIGYIVGNMFNLLKGLNPNIPNNPTDGTIADNITTDTQIPEIDPSKITLKPGDEVDLSSITEGFVSSDATESVSLMEEVGVNAIFDKAETLPNGKVRWHFKQPEGIGYSWIDKEKAQEAIANNLKKKIKIKPL